MLFSDVASYLKLEFVGKDVEIDSMNELSLSSPSQLAFGVHKKYSAELSSSKAKAFLITNALLEHLFCGSSYILCESNHLEIAPFSTFTARSGVTKRITQGRGVYSGFPLINHKEWSRLQATIGKLND